MYRSLVKRMLDIALSLTAIIVLFVPMLVMAIAVFLEDLGSPIFVQMRVGKNEKPFLMYKFRTMSTQTPHDVPTDELLNPESYITRIGGFLRKYSLDELPQLFNILFGQMSVVGPRPALPNQLGLICERRKTGAGFLRPGLTGWAQICGRDELKTDEKARLDGEYAERISFAFDVRCVMMTFGRVLRADGVVEGRQS